MLWAQNHEADFHTPAGTEITTGTEFGKPASATMGPQLQLVVDNFGGRVKGDGNRILADIKKCYEDIGELGWTAHQDYVNALYGIHNDCEARNGPVNTLNANTKASEYMHNLLNICNLKYEWDLVD